MEFNLISKHFYFGIESYFLLAMKCWLFYKSPPGKLWLDLGIDAGYEDFSLFFYKQGVLRNCITLTINLLIINIKFAVFKEYEKDTE